MGDTISWGHHATEGDGVVAPGQPQRYPTECLVCHAPAAQPCDPQCACAIAQQAIDEAATQPNRGEN